MPPEVNLRNRVMAHICRIQIYNILNQNKMANINENRLNTIISPADNTTIVAGFGSVNTTLGPYLTALTDEERRSLFSLKEENLVFTADALAQAEALGDLIPAALSGMVANMSNDLDLYNQLKLIENDYVAQLAQKVADTKRLSGHEAYTAALTIYKVIEALAAVGVSGAQVAYEILKVRFANQGGQPPIETP
jgi:hypothetical protein